MQIVTNEPNSIINKNTHIKEEGRDITNLGTFEKTMLTGYYQSKYKMN